MTHPGTVTLVHAGMWAKVPPTVAPTGTVTFPPNRMADTSFDRSSGLGSTSVRSNRMSMAAPWEWPMKATPRPAL